ncbi:MAG: SusC/RagA family TonB-linked outer membrane protein [Chitinophagaceae bacterium]|nr:SusC/RagA family TonB-linked outer membrane protein [Chitinophagaceae bacterium]
MKKKLFLLSFLIASICIAANAQLSVTGTVTDNNGDAMEGVTVSVKGTATSTSTAANGMFSLSVPSENSVLQFSFVGFASQEIRVGGLRNLNVRMAEEQVFIDTVLVVGYGTVKKEQFTGSATAINSRILSAETNSSVSRSLEGVVPGLQVGSVDGQPGLDMGIRIRGVSSTSQNSSNALIVIDGVPADYANVLASINPKDIASVTVLKDAASTAIYGSRGANGVVLVTTKRGRSGKTKISASTRMGFNYLNDNFRPKLIQSAKDRYEYTWEAIYNSARFGVAGNSSTNGTYTTNLKTPNMSHEAAAEFASQHLFDYTGSMTDFSRNVLGNWMLYDVPGATYTPTGSGSNASATMSGAYLVNTDGKLNPNAKMLFPAQTYNDYFFNKPFRQDHNVSASGGTDKMDYFLSVGYMEDPSYIVNSSFKRYNMRANINAQLTDWLKVGQNTGFTNRNTAMMATRFGRNPGAVAQNPFRWINDGNPLVSLFARDAQGNIIKDAQGNNVVVDREGISYSPLGPTTNQRYPYNLIKLMDLDKDVTNSNDLTMTGYATVTFLKDFEFTANMSYNRYADERIRYGNMETGPVVNIGSVANLQNTATIIDAQQLLNWGHKYGQHNLTALAGHEYYQYKASDIRFASAYSLIPNFTGSGNFTSHYNTAGSPFGVPGDYPVLRRMESYFGRVNYDFDNKYFFEGSVRRDGSSKFRYPGDRWGTFWSAGIGWRITAENFMEGTKNWLNDLKLRASYGVIGNESGIADYSGYQIWNYSANYQTVNNGTGVPASFNISQGALPNTTLTWENTNTFDAGIDFTVWDTRINGSIDYYHKLTNNAVFGEPLPISLGQSSMTKNSVHLLNRGIEIDINVDVIRNSNWRWNVGLTGTTYRTILQSFPAAVGNPNLGGNFTSAADGWGKAGTGTTGTDVYLRGEGKDWYNYYLYKYKGVDQNTGLPLFQHTVTQADHDAGRFTADAIGSYVNTTNYSLANKYEMGSVLPKWIGGLTTTLNYKNFDLSAVVAYQFGGRFLAHSYSNGYYMSGELADGISSEILHNSFNLDNTNAKFPMVFYNGDANYTSGATIGSWAYTDMSFFNASYFNLKNITLGYKFSDSFLRKLTVDNLRIFVTGQDILFKTSHSGFDPRLSLVGGMDVGAAYYLPLSSFSFGLDINF